ncbi:diguanylate cyclase (GGDEF)-like protein [Pseudacidovorax intermedius]|uniref:Diguanylate cyclase (GGDEF)-like protein n=1 Tax=Pseudacidovorax intermedius TaxID=433924 RepID=A0A370FC82_9BURK|nr:diguanylate cyclase [Pseudacidovorax intermedius]RDI22057.1 diguanylate cyclase (GGDEF)-like protein [Pseudacidovorax intermedius]
MRPNAAAGARHWRRLCLGALLWLGLTALAVAQAIAPSPSERQAPVAISRQAGGLPLAWHLQVLDDTSRRLTLDDVRQPEWQSRFALPDDPLLGREADRVLWFKFQLRLADPADAPQEWLLLVPSVSTHEMRFYGPFAPDGHALAEPVVTGMRHPWRTRPASSEQMAWRFHLPDAQPYTVYVRAESTFSRVYDMRVWRTADYLESTQDKRMFDGISYGILIGLLVYGLVLLLVFGEAIYVYYLLSCLCALGAIAGFNGHVLRYPFANWPWAAGVSYTLMPALWAICKLQFGRRLLNLRQFAPWLDRLVVGLLAALGVAAIYGLFGPHPLLTFNLVQASVVLASAVLLAGAIVAGRRRYWPAVLYCVGVALLLLAVGAIVFASWGWLSWRPGQMNLTQGALVLELVVFAVATASRLRLVLRSEQALAVHNLELVDALRTDSLTGVASRAGLEVQADRWLREGRPFAVLLLDLDGFKAVNDRHGHAAGDAVLAALAGRLRESVRDSDLVARLGGDEFALLVAGDPHREALAALAQRLLAQAALPVDWEGQGLRVGMSIGIACRPQEGDSLDALLRAADRAMYHSKQQSHAPGFSFAGDMATP